MIHVNCPSCYGSKTEVFFRFEKAPVQSVVVIKSKEDSLSLPRKDITLAFCHDCGFIYNSSFDTDIDMYTGGYEDQQGFSPTFRKFITSLTSRFIEKYNVRNKDIVEIGCGKGDFLALISELGNNRGTGIDPAYVEGRLAPDNRLKFLKEFYTEKHGELPNDVIVCRHTLEHIHATGAFMNTVRNSLTPESRTVLFFEVPSIVRILKSNAFWDIFYEHCSYFSPGSLSRLFRKNNFEVFDLYLEYDEQYLFIEAGMSVSPEKKHPLEESVDELWSMSKQFAESVSKKLDEWEELLNEYKIIGKKVVVWGGGSKSVGFLTHFDRLKVIKHVVDINPHLTGNYIPGTGLRYKSPMFLKEFKPDAVIIMNGIYEQEISSMLNEMELNPRLHSL